MNLAMITHACTKITIQNFLYRLDISENIVFCPYSRVFPILFFLEEKPAARFIGHNYLYFRYNNLYFRFGRKKSVIIPMVVAFIAAAISVSIPTDKSPGKCHFWTSFIQVG